MPEEQQDSKEAQREFPRELPNTIDSRDLMDLLGPEPSKAESSKAEPDISWGDEPAERAATPAPTPEPEIVVKDDDEQTQLKIRLDAAMRTNEALARQIEARRPVEPDIEFIEPMQGYRVPKESKYRPIQIPPALLEAVGIDPAIAPGLEVLGNVFYQFINSTVPTQTIQALTQRQQQDRIRQERYTSFQSRYDDLADKMDFVKTIEEDARREGMYQLPPPEYERELVRRTRSRLASIRGITLEQYENELNSRRNNSNSNSNVSSFTGRSRAVSAGTGKRTAPPRRGGDSLFEDSMRDYF